MELKIHTLGIVGSGPKKPGEKSGGNLYVMIEIDGLLIEQVDRAVLISKQDDFQRVIVRLTPGEVETIVHDADSWKALRDRLEVPA